MRKIEHSQNFIKNKKLLNRLIVHSNITSKDVVIDIGAGYGTITNVLKNYAQKVIAIEKDKNIYEFLKKRFSKYSNVEIIAKDVLNYHFPLKQYKVFANIPFNYTSDIIRRLQNQKRLPTDIYLFIQKEAALQYMGLPYHSESLKSLFIKTRFTLNIKYNFRSTDFIPIPRVKVVFLHLHLITNPKINYKDIKMWQDFLTFIFSFRPSNIRKALYKLIPYNKLYKAIRYKNISLNKKPSEIDFNTWVTLFEIFQQFSSAKGISLIYNKFRTLQKMQNKLSKRYRTRLM